MKSLDIVELAARNLRESVLRNSLTTLGIGVGVASLVAMLTLGVGLQQMATRRLEKSGLFDTVLVTSRRFNRGFGNRSRENNGAQTQETPLLNEAARARMAALAGVEEVTPDVRILTEVRFQDKPHAASVVALPMSSRDREAFENMQGAYFGSGSAADAIVVKDFGEELLGFRPDRSNKAAEPSPAALKGLIGQTLELHYAQRSSGNAGGTAASATPTMNGSPNLNRAGASQPAARPVAAAESTSASDSPADSADATFTVIPRTVLLRIVGIIDENPDSMRGRGRGNVFVPLPFAENLRAVGAADLQAAGGGDNQPAYSSLVVRVRGPGEIESTEDSIKKMGFNAFSALDATRSIKRFFAVLDLFLGIFGSLALAVASLGIINTLVMAILERRREIGILKALVASDGDVKKLFFAEAAAMGALGGVVGVALGWSIGKAINAGTNLYLVNHNFPPETIWAAPWWLMTGAIGFAVVVSLASGLYPAARAARLDPVKALRYE